MHKSILFVSPSAYPLGGVATWLDYIIPGLQKKGWDITLGLVSGKFHDIDSYMKRHHIDNIISIKNATGSREGRIRSIMKVSEDMQPDMVAVVNIPDTYDAVERLRAEKQAISKGGHDNARYSAESL